MTVSHRICVSVQAPGARWSWDDEIRFGIELDRPDARAAIDLLDKHRVDARIVGRSATYVLLGAYLGRGVRTRHDAVAWLNAHGFDATPIC